MRSSFRYTLHLLMPSICLSCAVGCGEADRGLVVRVHKLHTLRVKHSTRFSTYLHHRETCRELITACCAHQEPSFLPLTMLSLAACKECQVMQDRAGSHSVLEWSQYLPGVHIPAA